MLANTSIPGLVARMKPTLCVVPSILFSGITVVLGGANVVTSSLGGDETVEL